MRSFLEALMRIWEEEDAIHMKSIAHKYAERAYMDGEVIKKTGEVIPRESA